mmetsp:Transcript_34378/g.60255  ORF Transcript_34378/g.60255 Transcript_34378/m.60255 type:complete len:165 (-) Transcript_34378:1944-2438(-)
MKRIMLNQLKVARAVERKTRAMKFMERSLYPSYPSLQSFQSRKPDPVISAIVDHALRDLHPSQLPMNYDLIFFETGISGDETREVIRRMKASELPPVKVLEVRRFFLRLEEADVRLMVGREYSATKHPGFLTIPFNFEFEALEKFYTDSKQELQVQRHKLEHSK